MNVNLKQLRSFVEVARQLEGETEYRVRGGKHLGWKGPLWRPTSTGPGRTRR